MKIIHTVLHPLMVALLVCMAFKPAQAFSEFDVITPENIGRITELERLGRGRATHLDWHPEGEIVAFGGGWGVWLLDEAFNEAAHFTNILRTQDIAWHPSDNVLATLHDMEIRFWSVADDFSTVTPYSSLFVGAADTWYTIPFKRCIAWSEHGRIIGIGTQRDRGGDIPEWEPPVPASTIYYDVDSLQPTEGPRTGSNLETQLTARCRGGTASPDGDLTTWVAAQYTAGSTYTALNIISNDEIEPVAYTTFPTLLVNGMDWHPGGNYITLLYQHSIVNLAYPDLHGGDYFPYFNGYIDYVSWSPDGKHLLTYSTYIPLIGVWTLQAEGISDTQIRTVHARSDKGSIRWAENSQEIIAYTSEYGYENTNFIDIVTGRTNRSIWAGYDTLRQAVPEYQWKADYTRCAIYEPQTESVFIAEFSGEPGSAFWNGELERFVEGNSSDGTILPETRVPGTFPDLRSFSWRGDQLFINLDKDHDSSVPYLLDTDTGELTEIGTDVNIEPIAYPARWDLADDAGENEYLGYTTYNLWLNDPETGNLLSFNPGQSTPAAPIVEGGRPAIRTAVHPEQRLIAVSVGGGVNFWSLEDGSLLHSVFTESDIASLDWDPEGKLLAAGSMDGTVYLFGIGSF